MKTGPRSVTACKITKQASLRLRLAWSPNLFGSAVKLCNLAIPAPQFHDVSVNESLGRY
jgi:hypothetical protein